MTNGDSTVFPIDRDTIDKLHHGWEGHFHGYMGLSKREYIATQVLAGLVSAPADFVATDGAIKADAELAVKYTDALCDALNAKERSKY